jgi:hypothetical protein
MASASFIVSSSLVQFADQGLGTTSSPQTIQVFNTGTASTTFDVSLYGCGFSAGPCDPPGRLDFPFTSDCSSPVAPGASCTIRVVFKPSGTGARSALLLITDNANTLLQEFVGLSGLGVGLLVPTLGDGALVLLALVLVLAARRTVK